MLCGYPLRSSEKLCPFHIEFGGDPDCWFRVSGVRFRRDFTVTRHLTPIPLKRLKLKAQKEYYRVRHPNAVTLIDAKQIIDKIARLAYKI